MPRIRFDHPATVRLSFAPGDELIIAKETPEVHALLTSSRLDGAKVARIVRDDDEEETADASVPGDLEQATTGRGRRGSRSAPVP